MANIEIVQVKATIPRELKCRAFSALALRDEKFSRWLRNQLEDWLKKAEQSHEGMDVPEDSRKGVCRPE